MSKKLLRILQVFIGLFLVVCLAAAAIGYDLPRRSFPKTSGEFQLPSLSAPVEIYRDTLGIPYIYASNTYDLFFAQGFVHAQDRFWQMDFWRHVGSGRLSEMFGESQVETDQFLRTLGWARVAAQEIDQMDPESYAILQAYADGVNAYLAQGQGSALSLEYAVLGLINSGYRPEPWQVLNTLTYAKMMAWDLGGNMDGEITRAILAQTFTAEQMQDFYAPYPEDHPVIVSGFQPNAMNEGSTTDISGLPQLYPMLVSILHKSQSLRDLLGSASEGLGSNSWVISGALTGTGMPILADDPHLGIQMPSIWYENGLHCTPKSKDCPFEVVGFSFASAPGVVIGHNEAIAWGVTNLGPDVQDLYVEKINPVNPYQYQVNGQWVDMEVVQETILVAGGDPIPLEVRYTRHGPIISGVYGRLEDFTEKVGLTAEGEVYALALRWTALEPSNTFRSILKYNQAQNWDEFREAMTDFEVPSQNFVYADIQGNIGYQAPGKIPIRANGDGSLPVPGWTDEYEWVGFIPFDELPYAFNPPEGYIVTANNAVIDLDYPYFISKDWDRGYRAQRIVEMIEERSEPFDLAYIQVMHGDNKSLNAAALVPVLLEVPLDEPRLQEVLQIFQGWDYQTHMDSASAALFEVFWKHLLELGFNDDFPEDYPATGGSVWFLLAERLIDQPQSAWWDHQETLEVETRDDIFYQAFASAVVELESLQGKDASKWNWGDLHTVTFVNQTLGRSGPSVVKALFNRGPFRTSGSYSVVNNTGWIASTGSYEVRVVPSLRMIVDLSDLSNSISTNTTGQSGHAYHPNYINLADEWRTIQYHPMLWLQEDVQKAQHDHLRLLP
jgi:penicillin G amidase